MERLGVLEKDLKESVERNGAWVEHKDLLVTKTFLLWQDVSPRPGNPY